MRYLNFVCGILLLVLFYYSLKTLTTFPYPWDDEGLYAALGHTFGRTGKFFYPGYATQAPYTNGNALFSHFITGIYGILGRFSGYSLVTARSISFGLMWTALVLWALIAKRFNFPVFIACFLFAANERLFHASHVFRPEMSLALINTLFLFIFFKKDEGLTRRKTAFIRGIFNSLFVIVHGNGIASVAVNCVDFAMKRFETLRQHLIRNLVYYAGSFFALFIFYLVQIRDVGWLDSYNQLSAQPVQHKGFFELVKTDLSLRWRAELVVVGTSVFAKFMRGSFYLIILATALMSFFKTGGLPRRGSSLAFACFFSYMFLVHDKIDLHIAEMMPFFLLSFMMWFLSQKEKHLKSLAVFLLCTLLTFSGLLSFHHVLKYDETSPAVLNSQLLTRFLDSEKGPAAKHYKTFVGTFNYWFDLHDTMTVIHERFAEQHVPFRGGVIAADDVLDMPFLLKNCTVDYTDPEKKFRAFTCP